MVESPDLGYVPLQDWAFTQGFALVKESSRPKRWVLQCIHHKKETKDWCKTPKEARAAEADQEKLSRKAEKQLEITARYEAKLGCF